jgi:hypothetical protein
MPQSLPQPKPSYEELEAEVALLREQMTVVQAARWFDRYHALDAIKDDSCPACGGRVVAEETERIEAGKRVAPGVRLRAVPW